jgi:hypothetical protein
VDNNLGGCVYAMGRLFGPQLTGTVTNQVTGLPVPAEFRILGLDTSMLSARTSDPVTGRYRWVLNPGSYTIVVDAPGYAQQSAAVVVGPTGPTVMDFALIFEAVAVEPRTGGPVHGSLAAWPNPTRIGSRLRFHAGLGLASLEILDLVGRRVRVLFHGPVERGWSQTPWDGRDDAGRLVPNGLYVCRFVQGRTQESVRLVVTR